MSVAFGCGASVKSSDRSPSIGLEKNFRNDSKLWPQLTGCLESASFVVFYKFLTCSASSPGLLLDRDMQQLELWHNCAISSLPVLVLRRCKISHSGWIRRGGCRSKLRKLRRKILICLGTNRSLDDFIFCHLHLKRRVVIRPITFRSDWSYFMNFRVIGLIKVVSASEFRSDWSYKSQIRKNYLLQILCFEPEKPKKIFLKYTQNPIFPTVEFVF